MNPWAVAAAAAIGYAGWTLIKFLRADADFTLLSKRPPPPGAFRGKVVWIVGASQGLGEALAVQWAAAGARLILSSRSLEKLQVVREACLQHLPASDVELLPLDVLSPKEQLEAAAAAAFEAFGGAGVDYIVNNVGASQHAAVEDTEQDIAAALVQLNLLGPLALARAALPLMLRLGRGRHVVIASMSAVVPSPGQAAYAAAKAGLRAYFASLASELADRGVSVTLCCPGPFQSGGGGKPRTVYGPAGLIQQANTGISKNKVPVPRAAQLVVTAAYHRLSEVWIARQPVLVMGYLMQYLPWAGTAVLQRVGPSRARQLRDGSGSGYDVAAMLRK